MKSFIIFPENAPGSQIEEFDDKSSALKAAEEATKKTDRTYFVMKQIAVTRVIKTVEVIGEK